MAFGEDQEMKDFNFESQSATPRSFITTPTHKTSDSPTDPTGLDDLLALEAIVDRETLEKDIKKIEAQLKDDLHLKERGHGALRADATQIGSSGARGNMRRVLVPKSASGSRLREMQTSKMEVSEYPLTHQAKTNQGTASDRTAVEQEADAMDLS
ncbi:unnamed protein product [Zymoseptoria tritici ST99CH_1E4]|uniref:Uncharacterized protein n=2 Tax=Zymoseptoria tritici TaxID=1047171 RepID=F9XM04_ZYMTI|nr:uncharacterized protein MYCGRDRAFT_96754 [Zymoseptoria tritici IPO323]EGP83400.1 hypothetical protein MYCGRDRAFT_96754 [Zymoseptoria tritici IPO323]SMR60581.1 unnamed protein product [Zymoseptoria tritici ST99CH_1E4]